MNWSAALVALVPLPVVTVTSTVPLPAGDVAVIEVALLTVKEDAGPALPKPTLEAPEKFVPVMVTLVPPAPEPVFGLIPVTVGCTDVKVN